MHGEKIHPGMVKPFLTLILPHPPAPRFLVEVERRGDGATRCEVYLERQWTTSCPSWPAFVKRLECAVAASALACDVVAYGLDLDFERG